MKRYTEAIKLVVWPYTEATAEFSADRKYRYWLFRRWRPGPTLVFVMLNPSKAGADRDDPTVRKCVGFADRNGYGAILIVNLFSRIATNPRDLLRLVPRDLVGPDGDVAVTNAIQHHQDICFAWGNEGGRYVWRRLTIEKLIEQLYPPGSPVTATTIKVLCLGLTADGNPRHPGRLPYSTKLQGYR